MIQRETDIQYFTNALNRKYSFSFCRALLQKIKEPEIGMSEINDMKNQTIVRLEEMNYKLRGDLIKLRNQTYHLKEMESEHPYGDIFAGKEASGVVNMITPTRPLGKTKLWVDDSLPYGLLLEENQQISDSRGVAVDATSTLNKGQGFKTAMDALVEGDRAVKERSSFLDNSITKAVGNKLHTYKKRNKK